MRTLLLLVLLLISPVLLNAQRTAAQPPAVVKTAFEKKYPGATVQGWEKGKKNYRVEYKLKGLSYETVYTPAGEWVRTEREVEQKALPPAVSAAFKKTVYASWKINEIELHNTPEHPVVYKIEVKNSGKPDTALFFLPDGTQARTPKVDKN